MYLEMKSMLQGLFFYLKEYTGFIHKNDSDKNYNKKVKIFSSIIPNTHQKLFRISAGVI